MPPAIQAADEKAVMQEQFDILMERGAEDSRYLAVRAILLDLFEERAGRPFVMSVGGLV